MNKNLPLEQRIENAYGSQECERLHAIHQFLIATTRLREEYVSMWDKSDDASWGFNWGQLRGFREIWDANCNGMARMSMDYEYATTQVFPELASFERNCLDYFVFNELNSGVVEVADDGKSCRGAWMCHGMGMTRFNAEDGNVWGVNTFERYGADFIYDELDGRWKYLHEQVCSDFKLPMDGENWANQAYEFASLKLPAPCGDGWDRDIHPKELNYFECIGQPSADDEISDTDRKESERHNNEESTQEPASLDGPIRTGNTQWHNNYGALQPVQRSTAPPVPYESLDNNNSYVQLGVKPRDDLWIKNERGYWIVNTPPDPRQG